MQLAFMPLQLRGYWIYKIASIPFYLGVEKSCFRVTFFHITEGDVVLPYIRTLIHFFTFLNLHSLIIYLSPVFHISFLYY